MKEEEGKVLKQSHNHIHHGGRLIALRLLRFLLRAGGGGGLLPLLPLLPLRRKLNSAAFSVALPGKNREVATEEEGKSEE